MAIFLPSAHALKRVVAGLGPELAPILRLEMAAWNVRATHGKHATRKPVTVGEETFLSKFSFCVLSSVMLDVSVFKGAAIGLVKIMIAR